MKGRAPPQESVINLGPAVAWRLAGRAGAGCVGSSDAGRGVQRQRGGEEG